MFVFFNYYTVKIKTTYNFVALKKEILVITFQCIHLEDQDHFGHRKHLKKEYLLFDYFFSLSNDLLVIFQKNSYI